MKKSNMANSNKLQGGIQLLIVKNQFMQNFGKNINVLTGGFKAGISGLMNLATQASDSANGAYFVNFNQDCT